MAKRKTTGARKQQPEGALYAVLHREHQEVDQQLGALLSTKDRAERTRIWNQVYLALYAHAHAEQDEVYAALRDDLGSLVQHAEDEHGVVEAMMTEIDQLAPDASAFDEKVTKLREAVQEHVEEEEVELLPSAGLSAARDRKLTQAFEKRRDEILAEQRGMREEAPARGADEAAGLGDKSREALYQMAQDREITGRSKMKKEQLVEALSAENTQPG